MSCPSCVQLLNCHLSVLNTKQLCEQEESLWTPFDVNMPKHVISCVLHLVWRLKSLMKQELIADNKTWWIKLYSRDIVSLSLPHSCGTGESKITIKINAAEAEMYWFVYPSLWHTPADTLEAPFPTMQRRRYMLLDELGKKAFRPEEILQPPCWNDWRNVSLMSCVTLKGFCLHHLSVVREKDATEIRLPLLLFVSHLCNNDLQSINTN